MGRRLDGIGVGQIREVKVGPVAGGQGLMSNHEEGGENPAQGRMPNSVITTYEKMMVESATGTQKGVLKKKRKGCHRPLGTL